MQGAGSVRAGLLLMLPAVMPLLQQQHPAACFVAAPAGCRWVDRRPPLCVLAPVRAALSRRGGASIPAPHSETEAYLLDFVGVEAEQLAQLMDSKPFPNLREKSLDTDIRPCVHFLLEEVGLPRPSLGKALLTCPQLLGVGFKSLRAGFDFLIELGIPRARAARLVERFPHILKYSVEGNLRPAADFLQRELGLSQEQLARLVEREPGCLQLSVERNLLPTCSYLIDAADMTSDQLGKLVSTNPRVLQMSVAKKLKPKLAWMSELGVPQHKLARLLVSYPLLVSYSLGKLQNAERLLVEELGVPRNRLASVLLNCPQLFGLSANKVEQNVAYLTTRLGLTAEEMGVLAWRYPRALTYTIDNNLEPKLAYLTDDMEFTREELRREVLQYPLILGYSLERRIRPRYQHLLKCKVQVVARGQGKDCGAPTGASLTEPTAIASAEASAQAALTLAPPLHDKLALMPKRSRPRASGSVVDVAKTESGPDQDARRMIGLRSMVTPADAVFYARYREEKSLLNWVTTATINSDPYALKRKEHGEDHDFFLDIAHLHADDD